MHFRLEDYHIQGLINSSEVRIKDENEIMELPYGGFMYYGEIIEDTEDKSTADRLLYNQP